MLAQYVLRLCSFISYEATSYASPGDLAGFPASDMCLSGSSCGWRDGHAGRGGFPHQSNLRRGQAVGLVCEVAEGALQFQGLGGEGAGGLESAGAFLAKGVEAGG